MAKIPLSRGTFEKIPEGRYLFEITTSKYDSNFGEIKMDMVCEKGTYVQKFGLLQSDGETNEKVYNFFSFFAKVALGDFDRVEIDESELVGCKMWATVVHNEQPNKKDPTKTFTYVNLSNIKSENDEDSDDEKLDKAFDKDIEGEPVAIKSDLASLLSKLK